jgi:RNA polymerase-binding transcription factor DksA
MGQSEAARLREVEAAQGRLARGTYGVCEDCGEPIDPVRLDLVPEARRCAPDQEEYEHTRAQERTSLTLSP